MRYLILLSCLSIVSCGAASPGVTSANDIEPSDEPPEAGEAAMEGNERVSTDTPRVVGLVDELTQILNAALSGQDLPETSFTLPGARGEQVVSVQRGFPQGALTAYASLFKIDVTLDGCGDQEGLTVGIVQAEGGEIFLIGLGDQVTTSEAPPPSGLDEVSTLAVYALAAIELGEASSLILSEGECAELFGGSDRCRQTFRELPGDETLDRYRQLLMACEAEPRLHLSILALWLRDEEGGEFQAMSRLGVHRGRLQVTAPIAFASIVP